jgi:hypothetical protein
LTPEALRGIRRTRRLIRRVILEEVQENKGGQKEKEKEKAKGKENVKSDAEVAEATTDRVRERIKREQKAKILLEDEERASSSTSAEPLKLTKFAVCVDAEVSDSKEPSIRFGDGLWVGKRLFAHRGCHHIPEMEDVPADPHPLPGEDTSTVAFIGGSFLVEGLKTTQDKAQIERVLEFLVRGEEAVLSRGCVLSLLF